MFYTLMLGIQLLVSGESDCWERRIITHDKAEIVLLNNSVIDTII